MTAREFIFAVAASMAIDALAVWAATRKPRARRWPWLTRSGK